MVHKEFPLNQKSKIGGFEIEVNESASLTHAVLLNGLLRVSVGLYFLNCKFFQPRIPSQV